MDVRDEIGNLDPEAEDFEDRVAKIEKYLQAQERRKQYEAVKGLLGVAVSGNKVVTPIEALWGDGDIAAQVKDGHPVNRAAHFSSKALLTNPGDVARQISDVRFAPPTARRLRDVLGPVPLGPNERSVSFVRETSYTVSADVVVEGAAKPESALSLEAKTEAAKNIAHHIPVTRQALLSREGMQRYVERRLLDGLLAKVDDKLINGAGGGADVPGYLSDPGVGTVAQATGETKVDALVKAVVAIANASDGTYPSGVVINYNDYYSIVVAKGTDNHYLFPELQSQNLANTAVPFFGTPVVATNKIAAGTALVGAFGSGSALYEVEQGVIRATESHADEFIKNIVRIMAEIEVVHTIELPGLFRKVTFA